MSSGKSEKNMHEFRQLPEESVKGAGAIWLDYIDITDLKMNPENPKDHDLGAINESVKRFGFLNPMAINEESGYLIWGHGRLKTLLDAKRRGTQPPDNVIVQDGNWYAPVIRGIHLNEMDETAYVIADNQLTILGGWNEPVLLKNLFKLKDNLDGVGFSEEEIDHLNRTLNPSDSDGPLPHIDQAAKMQSKWGTAPGQLWIVPSIALPNESHRIICADCRDEAALDRLMNGRRAGVIMTDPPYNVDHQRHRSGKRTRGDDSEHYDMIASDAMSEDDYRAFLTDAFSNINRHMHEDASWYVWHASIMREFNIQALNAIGVEVHQEIVWNKDNFFMGRQDYHWKHEPCLYGWGEKHQFHGSRNQSTVWDVHRDKRMVHPTIKPVGLYMYPCRNNIRHGEIIVDIFAGTGPAIVAAERTSRLAYLSELDPKYLAVILERAREMGLNPVLEEKE